MTSLLHTGDQYASAPIASPSEEKGSDDAKHGYENSKNMAPVYGKEEVDLVPEAADANHGLKRTLQSRHMQMIAFGGAIGTGLLVGSGSSLSTGGPGFLLIGFALVGFDILAVVFALAELATTFPTAGSFAAYNGRFIEPAVGFAVGWNYLLNWIITLPLELVAASLVIGFWDPDGKVPAGVWIAVFLIAIIGINCFGARGYGEVEFAASMIKIVAILGFMIAAIVINCGGAPGPKKENGDSIYMGFHTFKDPGAFVNGFKGFVSVFVTAAFAFSGTEAVGLAAAESESPQKTVPKASKQVFWRIVFLFIGSLFLVCLIVPYNDPRLTNGKSSYDARASPYVVALEIGAIKVLPSIFNAVILVSVLSVGNSAVYVTSRTLHGLANNAQAPSFFGKADKKGRPVPAVGATLAFGLLGFLVYTKEPGTVFNWLLSISGISQFLVWGGICLAHVRFRAAWKAQNMPDDELPWRSPLGVWGSWFGFLFNAILLIFEFYIAVWPIGFAEMSPQGRASNFFQVYLAAIIVIVCYIGFKVARPSKLLRATEIDLSTGRFRPNTVVVTEKEQGLNSQA
ncbi:unnamed protein product [Parajaminaea phylloscopi]